MPDWYDFLHRLRPTSEPVLSQSAYHTATLLNNASSLHASELANFSTFLNASSGSVSDQSFLRNVLTGGTLSDRLSTLTLMAQGAPLRNIRALEALKSLAEKRRRGMSVSQDGEKGKEERPKAARAITDWWIGGGAPNRKFKYFRDQPLLPTDTFSSDPLPYARTQSLTLIPTLLCSNLEQEQTLLRLLVNKLGDLESAISARTSLMRAVLIRGTTPHIMCLTPPSSLPTGSCAKPTTHIRFKDNPKPTPKRERNFWRAHTRYYAAVTFNQNILSPSGADHAVAHLPSKVLKVTHIVHDDVRVVDSKLESINDKAKVMGGKVAELVTASDRS
ncbi:hypothetical protein H4582DRAFT_2056406 [Lactarius indigo]|nr:hypothetical protein H4582DRAFT_2056406 [Lactarius indigo]